MATAILIRSDARSHCWFAHIAMTFPGLSRALLIGARVLPVVMTTATGKYFRIISGKYVLNFDGYVIRSISDLGSALNPLMKEVGRQPGAWFQNFSNYLLLWTVQLITFLGAA